jgi:EAL domain-containing protein (putative c-di-GMP-specific phosphodiesterase class I)
MKKLGCCHAQGYLYSRPLNTADFWAFLKKSDISSTNKCMIN